MNHGYVACPCCGKPVSTEDIELAFHRPDAIAALTQAEQEARCKQDDDLCALDGERFFVRGTIPLPVAGSASTYAIGAWAEIAEADFRKILSLWIDENQAEEPAISGSLANDVPSTTNSAGCDLAIRLTGPTTRPHFFIADDACSIFSEQKSGIPLHRAGQYSDLFRKKNVPREKYALIEEDDVDTSTCSCCDSALHLYGGRILRNGDQEASYDYWVEIPEGHGGSFSLLISLPEAGAHRIAVLRGEASEAGLTYRLLDRKDSPWKDMGDYGRVMDRSEALGDGIKTQVFELVDKIAARDTRLLAHTGPYLGLAQGASAGG